MSNIPIPPMPIPQIGLLMSVPVGTVVAYAGQATSTNGANTAWPSSAGCASTGSPPGNSSSSASSGTYQPPEFPLETAGWMLCDGRKLSAAQYPELFAVLGCLYGCVTDGQGNQEFYIPDYRGLFLRGADEGAGMDPDVSSRMLPNQSGTGSAVGSLQCDALQTHQHQYNEVPTQPTIPPGNDGTAAIPPPSQGLTSPPTNSLDTNQNTVRTSNGETRPKNVYVNYIIKYSVRMDILRSVDPANMLPR